MYTIQLPTEPIKTKKLPFGGTNKNGTSIEVNSVYYLKNNKPWIPVTGEFQFSRYPKSEWEKALLKMKAGGVQIVATYVFWIHHEEEKGVWDFTGQRDLKSFIALCKKHSLDVMLRCGPWAHGECRNGGFPDWLQHNNQFELRTNSDGYLACVKEFFQKIYSQVEGYFFKDNGPIIGMQIENEYGPCGGPSDLNESLEHMHTLKKMINDIGFDSPLYTATVWGGGRMVENETLPVEAAYVDAPWSSSLEDLPPSVHLLLQLAVNDPSIGSDLKKDAENNDYVIDVNNYPYSTAELGGGVQSTHHRRMVIDKNDTKAMTLCKLGSGANLIGYYIYHGGTNPVGKHTTLNESKLSGNPHECPIKCYDFEAPLGECGRSKGSYGGLKTLHLFLEQWGDILANSKTVMSQDNPTDPTDLKKLRFCARHNADENCGFLFINNHVRKHTMAQHKDAIINVQNEKINITFPKLDVKNGDMMILPYNLKLGDTILESTNAQPLTKIDNHYFFTCDSNPVYNFKGESANITTLTTKESENAFKFNNKLYISDQDLFEKEGVVYAESDTHKLKVDIYDQYGNKQSKKMIIDKSEASCKFKQSYVSDEFAQYEIKIKYDGKLEDAIASFEFVGDKIEIYNNGHLISDYFACGKPFNQALKRENYPKKLTARVYKSKESGVYYTYPVEKGLELKNVKLIPLYKFELDK